MEQVTRKRWTAWVSVIVVGTAGLFSCDVRESSSGLPIGVILPFSGELSDGAEQIKWTLEHARREEGADFRFLYRDDLGKPGRAAELVHELAEEGVIAIIGTMSSPCALAAAERAEALAIPFMTPMATHSDVTKDREWAFRMCFTDPEQGAEMAKHAASKLGVKRVAIVRDVSNDYSLGLSDSFAGEYLARGGQIVGCWDYRADYDRREDLARWVESVACDAIYLPLYGDAIAFVIDGTESIWRARPLAFLGGDGWHTRSVTDYLAGRDPVPSPVDVTAHFARDRHTAALDRFVTHFSTARGEAPYSSAVLAYDMATVLARAMREGVVDRTGARDGLRRELAHFEGLTGDTFLEPASGTITKAIPVLTWKDGDWHAVGNP